MIMSLDDIMDLLEAFIANYGKPEQILTAGWIIDRTQFYATRKSDDGLGVSAFDLWCYENGMRYILAG